MSMSPDASIQPEPDSWLNRPVFNQKKITVELVIFFLIVGLGIVSRFYDLGSRVMSHDENTHVYYSWRLYTGEGFMHDPLMHGTFLFHVVAASYFMFGDNDFTAKIPSVLCSILTIIMMWKYRRYLGKAGAGVAAVLFLISPYMLFYGRYVRNEAYVALFSVVSLWAILRYLETGQAKYTYWLSVSLVLHFTAKETSFIFAAQALLFLFFYQIFQLVRKTWQKPEKQNYFVILFLAGILLLSIAGSVWLITKPAGADAVAGTATLSEPGDVTEALPATGPGAAVISIGLLGIISILGSMVYLITGYTWKALKEERAFSLLLLIGTMVLPMLSAFPVRMMGWDIPTNASEVAAINSTTIFQIGVFLVPFFLISVVIGLFWNPRLWSVNAAIWYAIFTVLYTTVFTHGAGFLTGMVGSLGYWLEQQAVNRGSQPWYYYGLIQIPVYEFLPALGCVLAAALLIFRKFRTPKQAVNETDQRHQDVPTIALLGFWILTALFAYSYAGEKMPWLTVHIVLPMILLAGWAINQVIERTDWRVFTQKNNWLALVVLILCLVSFGASLSALFGSNPPFQGKDLGQIQATSTFLLSFIMFLGSGILSTYLFRNWKGRQVLFITTLTVFAFLSILTVHTAIQASYINYDNANELLVYAHSAGGVKDALKQIEDISYRTTNGLDMVVAYDNETSYPYYWYLRDYPNARYFGDQPSRSLRDAVAILVGDTNYQKIEPVVRNEYVAFDYIRLWWPNEDYKGLTWQRIWDALRDSKMREALFQIWLNRDYTLYGEATGKDMRLVNWTPSVRMRLYLRKDVVSKLWDYGVGPVAEETTVDPYEGKGISLAADRMIGSFGVQPGQFNRPRGIAVAPDGTLYVADTDNHRIQHLTPQGKVLQTWGQYGDIATGAAPGGTFNQPWGIAVGADGSVYVADVWNHRVQKFTANGDFVSMWGAFGQAESLTAFWGPRDIAIDSQGRLFVTDTGNKRVVVFDANGQSLFQFGSAGMGEGEFDEPVGIAIDQKDNVYIADTWNQRVQVFSPDGADSFTFARQWDISGWVGQSLDNKPYMDVDDQGHVFLTDPEGLRILEFTSEGEFTRFWGDIGTEADGFGLVGALAVDDDGSLWVTDSGNHRIMHFVLPAK